ncbi:flagellar assembly peptidoglycan hydrolase FlgJ [Ramlibacter sp.]|uniref:flagellar assembly peptidoglycan hydrolase FlgJ n=1 Tax=Ramlibacter sp. TaxID=1917967 RepID=UPI003D1021F8
MRAESASIAQLDSRGLDALRRQAAQDPKQAARHAAVQFESLFMQMVLKSMRDASPKPSGGSGEETFSAMMDSQLSRQFAGRPGGLAQMLERQLAKHMGNLPAVSPENVQSAPMPAAATPATATPAARGAPAEFIRKMLPHAQEAERRTGVPASFILGQAALESGWGRGEVRNADGSNSHNLFGVKAGASWRGERAEVATTEFENGQAVRTRAAFRSYDSYADAFADYARLISSQPRYAGVVRGEATAEAFAGGMQRAGYATDPNYAQKLARTINQTLAMQRAMG